MAGIGGGGSRCRTALGGVTLGMLRSAQSELSASLLWFILEIVFAVLLGLAQRQLHRLQIDVTAAVGVVFLLHMY